MLPAVPPRSRVAARAFTLIEILVVVAIIALLIAVLLPSLKRARDQAMKAACLSNLHQIGLGLTYYTETFKKYPAHHTRGGTTYAVWPPRLLPYVVSPTARRGGNNNADVFWCPSSPASCRWDGKKKLRPDASLTTPTPIDEHRSFSYGYNDWGLWEVASVAHPLLGLGAWEGDAIYGSVPVGRVKRPAEMFALSDNDIDPENVDRYNGSSVWDTAIDPTESPEFPGKRHGGGHNMLCADSHVEFILQKKNIHPYMSLRTRQRWNNDFKPHVSNPLTGGD